MRVSISKSEDSCYNGMQYFGSIGEEQMKLRKIILHLIPKNFP